MDPKDPRSSLRRPARQMSVSFMTGKSPNDSSSSNHSFIRAIPTPGGLKKELVEYAGPVEIQPRPRYDNPARQTYPAYVDTTGNLLDLDYILVPVPSAEEHAEDVYDVAKLKEKVPSSADLKKAYSDMPNPEMFKSYEEFEAALLKWKESVTSALGYVQKPGVAGRTLNRPRLDAKSEVDADEGDEKKNAQPVQQSMRQTDPWNASLIPPEPNPFFYEDYDQYELALQRWHIRCCKSVNSLVPHPSQLQYLNSVKIRPAKTHFGMDAALESAEDEQGESEAENTTHMQSISKLQSPYAEYCNAWRPHPHVLPKADKPVQVLRQGLKASLPQAQVMEQWPYLMDTIDAILNDRNGSLKKTKSCTPPAHIDPATLPPLPHNVNTRINWDKALINDVRTDPFVQDVRSMLEEVQQSPHLSVFKKSSEMSLMYPLLAEKSDKLDAENEATLGKPGFSLNDVVHILRTPTFVCNFISLMDKPNPFAPPPLPGNPSSGTYFDVVAAAINSSNWTALLRLWENSNDPLILGKLSWLFDRLLRKTAGSLLEKTIASVSLTSCQDLYLLIRCLLYKEMAPFDVFPFSMDKFKAFQLALHRWPKVGSPSVATEIEQQILRILLVYYLRSIVRHVSLDSLNRVANQLDEALSASIMNAPVIPALFYLMSHRSSTVCVIAFVVTVQLIHSPNRKLQEYLRSDEGGMIRQTREMSSVNFSHTQFVARRLTEIFLGDALWCSVMDKYFTTNKDILQESVQSNDALTMRFAVIVYINALTRIRDVHSAESVRWVLGNAVFMNVLKCLKYAVNDKLFSQSASLARIFMLICSKCEMLNLIDCVSADSYMDTADPNRVRVSYSTMFAIMDIVQQLNRESLSTALTTRSYVMSAISSLIRKPDIFALVRAEIPQKVLGWCKDGKHYQCNKNAWKLFYQMIACHSGMLEELIQNKQLGSFTDLLNGRNAVTINSIHYIGKLFTMLASENKRLQYRRPTKREDLKSVERDVKTFCQFFRDRSCFIKLHLIYTSRSSTQLGAAFLEIAKLYYSLATLPECEKLFTFICKDVNYKVGILGVKAMYTSV